MKHLLLTAALASTILFAIPAHPQASTIPSAAPVPTTGTTPEQRGRILVDQMIEALGGPLWLNRSTLYEEGHTAAFFRGAPTGSVVDFWSFRQFPLNGQPDIERVEYTKKRDVVHIFTPAVGYEVTYKGKIYLPAEQIADHNRRWAHSLEEVVHVWLKQPGVIILAEGTAMVERRMVDKVSILSPNNDTVVLELDTTTHLPLRRTYQSRNNQFKDLDEDAEEYDDYHTIQGFPTPFAITRYHNGDMNSQLFIKKVEYGKPMPPELFNPDLPLKKGH